MSDKFNTNLKTLTGSNYDQGKDIIIGLNENDTFGIMLEPEYLAIFQQFITEMKTGIKENTEQRSQERLTQDLEKATTPLSTQVTALKAKYLARCQTNMDEIARSYAHPVRTEFSDTTAALDETLRRQDFKAELSFYGDDELKEYARNVSDQMIALSIFDEKLLADEMKKRNLDFDASVLHQNRLSAYKTDPIYSRIERNQNFAKSYFTVPGFNSSDVAMPMPNPDTTKGNPSKILFVRILDEIGNGYSLGDTRAIQDKVATYEAIARFLKPIVKRNENTYYDQVTYKANAEVDNQKQYLVADNDPRIIDSNKNYDWSIAYYFLNERFGDDPKIANSPLYAVNADYDINKRYEAMKQIYADKSRLKTYTPKYVIDTKGVDPKSWELSEIEKVFGTEREIHNKFYPSLASSEA